MGSCVILPNTLETLISVTTFFWDQTFFTIPKLEAHWQFQGGHIPVKIKFPVFPEFSLCYEFLPCVFFFHKLIDGFE